MTLRETPDIKKKKKKMQSHGLPEVFAAVNVVSGTASVLSKSMTTERQQTEKSSLVILCVFLFSASLLQ